MKVLTSLTSPTLRTLRATQQVLSFGTAHRRAIRMTHLFKGHQPMSTRNWYCKHQDEARRRTTDAWTRTHQLTIRQYRGPLLRRRPILSAASRRCGNAPSADSLLHQSRGAGMRKHNTARNANGHVLPPALELTFLHAPAHILSAHSANSKIRANIIFSAPTVSSNAPRKAKRIARLAGRTTSDSTLRTSTKPLCWTWLGTSGEEKAQERTSASAGRVGSVRRS